jgi:hypothetical protein
MHGSFAFSTDDISRLMGIAGAVADRHGLPLKDSIDRIEALATDRSAAAVPRRSMRDYAAGVRRLRMRRNQMLGVPLFRDPAWDMLLDLVIANEEGQQLPVSCLCHAAGVPHTTALRTLDRLERRGLITRTPDPHDHRRILVTATPETLDRVRTILMQFQDSG